MNTYYVHMHTVFVFNGQIFENYSQTSFTNDAFNFAVRKNGLILFLHVSILYIAVVRLSKYFRIIDEIEIDKFTMKLSCLLVNLTSKYV